MKQYTLIVCIKQVYKVCHMVLSFIIKEMQYTTSYIQLWKHREHRGPRGLCKPAGKAVRSVHPPCSTEHGIERAYCAFLICCLLFCSSVLQLQVCPWPVHMCSALLYYVEPSYKLQPPILYPYHTLINSLFKSIAHTLLSIDVISSTL